MDGLGRAKQDARAESLQGCTRSVSQEKHPATGESTTKRNEFGCSLFLKPFCGKAPHQGMGILFRDTSQVRPCRLFRQRPVGEGL
jgi:hypothetical protein